MKVSFREQGNTRIVNVAGAVDLDTAPLLRQHLFEALGQAPRVALNLAAISFIETSGIAVLLEALLESERRHGQFVLFAMNTAVRDDFRIAHVAKVFHLADTEEQALIAKWGSRSFVTTNANNPRGQSNKTDGEGSSDDNRGEGSQSVLDAVSL